MGSIRVYNITGGRVKKCIFGFIIKGKRKKEKGIKITNLVAYFYLFNFILFSFIFKD
jgi:hypothetical protein